MSAINNALLTVILAWKALWILFTALVIAVLVIDAIKPKKDAQ